MCAHLNRQTSYLKYTQKKTTKSINLVFGFHKNKNVNGLKEDYYYHGHRKLTITLVRVTACRFPVDELTWTVVSHGIDTGAHVANPDFREVMTSHQHLAKDTENIWPHKTGLKKKWGTSNHWQQQPVNSFVHNRTAVALFYCWTKITQWHTAVPHYTKSLPCKTLLPLWETKIKKGFKQPKVKASRRSFKQQRLGESLLTS